MELITDILQAIMQPCYDITGNWWLAILLFTIIVKIVLMPMSLWVQKNGIVMVQLMPELNRIKVKHYGDQEAIGEKQSTLFKEKHYHPMLSLVPLAVQVIILFGLVDVIHLITDHGAPGTEFLGLIPFEDGGVSWIMPLLAGLSAVVLGYAQNRINPLQREQSRSEKNMTNGISIGLSLFLGVFVAAGMCFYWIVSNLTSILVQVACNIIINPKKHIDYAAVEESRNELEDLNALDKDYKKKWYRRDPLAKREKADYKRFFNIIGKHIVFYSEGSGFYKYFKGAIEWLLENSDMRIHYVTNDPNDQIFAIAEKEPRIRPYYIGQKRAITLMMKMDADVVVATLEDLENYYIKRSYVREDVEYVFTFHHMTSSHLVARREALDHYDAILCAGPHQITELRRAEELRGLPKKELVACGYPLLDKVIASYEELAGRRNERPVILIGPSWQEDCLLDNCIEDMLDELLKRDWRIIVRPHPEYTKRYKARWKALQARYEHVDSEKLYFEQDFASNESIFTSDILITDWSSVSCDFSFSTKRPTVFIDTPMKICNPDYEELGIEPTDITLRNQIGASLKPDEMERLCPLIDEMLTHGDEWRARITEVLDGFIFNLGRSSEAAGEFLLQKVLEKQAQRKASLLAMSPAETPQETTRPAEAPQTATESRDPA